MKIRHSRSTEPLPDTFSIDARGCPQALQLAQAIGPVVEPDFDGIMGLAVVEFGPRRHASSQKVPCRHETIWGFLHTDGASRHDN